MDGVRGSAREQREKKKIKNVKLFSRPLNLFYLLPTRCLLFCRLHTTTIGGNFFKCCGFYPVPVPRERRNFETKFVTPRFQIPFRRERRGKSTLEGTFQSGFRKFGKSVLPYARIRITNVLSFAAPWDYCWRGMRSIQPKDVNPENEHGKCSIFENFWKRIVTDPGRRPKIPGIIQKYWIFLRFV